MKRIGRVLIAGAFLMLAAFVVCLGQSVAQAAPNAIVLTGPAPNTVIAETDDYATQILGDPWDMNNLDDFDQPYHMTSYGVNSGIWTGTTTGAPSTASVWLQYQNYPNSYSYLGEDDGVNNPIHPNRYTRLLFRMFSPVPSHSVMYYFKHHTYTPAGNSGIIPVEAGWHIYSIDLRQVGSANWLNAGPYEGLRLDPPSPSAGNVVHFDWVRLTPDTGQTVRITWTGATGGDVKLYLSLSPIATEDNEYLIATTSSTAGAYSWNTTGVAPGAYYFHAESGGSWSSIGPLIVNQTPLVRIDAPGPLSGEEYAYASQAAGWDGNFPDQFDSVHNVNNLSFAPDAIRGAPANLDPSLYWLDLDSAHAIDANKYHYFNVKFWLSPPAQRPYSPFNAGTRLLWGSNPSLSDTEIILAPYNRWISAAYDLRLIQQSDGSPSNWEGTKNTFRFDPLEEDDANGEPAALPTGFMIQAAHLTSDPVAGHMGGIDSGLLGTIIRWTPLQGDGVLTLYRQAAGDESGSDDGGVLIAQNLPISQGQYLWDTSQVPPGTYLIYADVQDALNISRAVALAPIVVTRQQPATLFNDVPGNLWAVDFINRLARLNIIGGSGQPDTTVLFKPSNTATRAQLSKMVVLAAGWTLLNPPTATFNDVPVGSTFYQYVETAADHEVINGYDCGGPGEPCPGRYFRPNNNVTRGQVTKMIMLAFGFPENTSGGPHFSDVPAGSTFYANIETLFNLGIIGGYSDGTFRPSNLVSRAQVSKMISLGLDVP